jgi:DNA-binding MarR family transcriptional regulator
MEKTAFTIDLENSVGPWIGKTTKIVDYYLHEALQQHGLDLTKEQMIVLKKLHQKDGLNQNELARLTWRDKSSLARLLAKMEQKEYISRKKLPSDKRINQVFLTATGREVFETTRPVIQEIIGTMEKGISEADIQHMITILKRIQYNFTAEIASI